MFTRMVLTHASEFLIPLKIPESPDCGLGRGQWDVQPWVALTRPPGGPWVGLGTELEVCGPGPESQVRLFLFLYSWHMT